MEDNVRYDGLAEDGAVPESSLGSKFDEYGEFSSRNPGEIEEWVRNTPTSQVYNRVKAMYKTVNDAEERTERIRITANLISEVAHNVINGEGSVVAIESKLRH